MSGWFITGTDTGVGKTRISEALLQALVRGGHTALGMKPVASGAHLTSAGLRNEDAERLLAAGTTAVTYDDLNPYVFEPAIAPHAAAARIGVSIDIDTICERFKRLQAMAAWLVVEGAGGWRVPIGAGRYMSDIATALQLPVVLVVGLRLGCINHTLLTVDAIRRDGCSFFGWVGNPIDPTFAAEETIATLSEQIGAPLALAHYDATSPPSASFGDALCQRLLG